MSEYYSYWHIYGAANGTGSNGQTSQFYDISFDAKVAIGTIAAVSGLIIVAIVTWLTKRRQTFREKAARRYRAVKGIGGTGPALLQPPAVSTNSLNIDCEGLTNSAFNATSIYQPRSDGGAPTVIAPTNTVPDVIQRDKSPTSQDYEVVPTEENDTRHLIESQ